MRDDLAMSEQRLLAAIAQLPLAAHITSFVRVN
jgi:hypothetical protein